jgi:signal transduction histidine kinase
MTSALSSLPVRFALLALALAVLGATAIGAFIGYRANALLTDRAMEIIRTDADALNSEFRAGGIAQLAKALDTRVASTGLRHYGLLEYVPADRSLKPLAGDLTVMPRFTAGASVPPIATHGTFFYSLAAAPGIQRLAAGVRIPVNATTTLIVARDLEDQQAFIRTLQISLSVGLVGLTALAFAGAAAARRHFASRVDAVTSTARSIMTGALNQRIPLAGTDDEIDRLSTSLNDMLARNAQLMSSLREVSDNIAHDLKTPLNRLRNRAEAALRDPAGGPAYREGLEATIEEADGLIRTFNALLLIARLEASAVADSMTVLDPALVIADVAELYQPVAEEQGRTLRVDAPSGWRVKANRHLLGQVLSNLVENAIKYGTPNGTRERDNSITVSLSAVGDHLQLTVADHGPGIREADHERALKRFVRLEESRTQPGTGLGLSLVAAVARLHGGTIHFEDNHPGLRVILSVPMLSAPPSAKRSPELASTTTSARIAEPHAS